VLKFVITLDPARGYSWVLVNNRGERIARPGSYDYSVYKEPIIEAIKEMKIHTFTANIEDNTPAKMRQ